MDLRKPRSIWTCGRREAYGLAEAAKHMDFVSLTALFMPEIAGLKF